MHVVLRSGRRVSGAFRRPPRRIRDFVAAKCMRDRDGRDLRLRSRLLRFCMVGEARREALPVRHATEVAPTTTLVAGARSVTMSWRVAVVVPHRTVRRCGRLKSTRQLPLRPDLRRDDGDCWRRSADFNHRKCRSTRLPEPGFAHCSHLATAVIPTQVGTHDKHPPVRRLRVGCRRCRIELAPLPSRARRDAVGPASPG